MQTTTSMFIPLQYHQFDEALEAVMIAEEQQTAPRPSLADHPVFWMLLDGVEQLNTPNDYGVKMTTPVDHTPEVTIVTRVKAIAGFFNAGLTAQQWQAAADHHPAAEHIASELQEALNSTLAKDGTWTCAKLAPIMDRLDAVGFQTAFDKATLIFSITFKEHADVKIADTQHDLKNKRLLDEINGVDSMENPQGGWVDDKPTFTRQHPWKIQLKTPRPLVLRRQLPEEDRFQFRDVIVAKPSFPRRSD